MSYVLLWRKNRDHVKAEDPFDWFSSIFPDIESAKGHIAVMEAYPPHGIPVVILGIFTIGDQNFYAVNPPHVQARSCGEKATVTRRCVLPAGHSGPHDEDP